MPGRCTYEGYTFRKYLSANYQLINVQLVSLHTAVTLDFKVFCVTFIGHVLTTDMNVSILKM